MAQQSDDDKAEHPPQVTVCVIAYNSGPTLRTCLARLGAQTFRDFETLVIDNDSPDPGDAAIAAEFPWARLIRNDSNLGFTGAGNQGAREGRGRWYVLLNPDAYAEPNWLAKLVDAAARNPKVSSFTSRQMVEGEPGVLDGLGDVMSITGIPYRGGYLNRDEGQAREGEVFSPCGASMMIDRRLFLDLGGFDEDFFCYGEDVDLGYRLQLVGQPTLLVPDATIHHVGSASSGGRKSEFAVFHGTRNRFWVLFKNTPALLLPLVVPLHLMALVLIYLKKDNRPHIRLILRAVRAAFAGAPLMFRSRAKVQEQRKASLGEIARAMTWNPKDLSRRRPVIRPLRASAR
ncbi:MAG: glycosyltransferase family 2 protein [Alphaproteobacteria bacterium]|nr:glycosyltransferase family 2 protein [Alphaproteobacteria bacterium]MBU1517076.1 glycosyltransferase family 2 protein [Alphaproteobacteria bacterium]MBU2093695.1 glycosyltransferase family 2 protein [Alphaproteobacteria bacterium]MBU2153983.1 glycosyltransferase family 2 protein [Alphaproteobacteria bacterium]MBU2308705.1 glycosyltransferase family 2 protein [Alphaproteobacteria bacterium]